MQTENKLNISESFYKQMREMKDAAIAEIRTLTNEKRIDFDENGFEDDNHNDIEATDGYCIFLTGGDYYVIEEMNLPELLLVLSTIEDIKNKEAENSPVLLTDTAPFEPYDEQASHE